MSQGRIRTSRPRASPQGAINSGQAMLALIFAIWRVHLLMQDFPIRQALFQAQVHLPLVSSPMYIFANLFQALRPPKYDVGVLTS